jgi:hypothetical protein
LAASAPGQPWFILKAETYTNLKLVFNHGPYLSKKTPFRAFEAFGRLAATLVHDHF